MLSSCLFVSLLSLPCLAWGSDGHEIVASIAQKYLDPVAASHVNSLLGGDMAPASTWADKIKHSGQYSTTGPLHYIDVKDRPPSVCGLVEERDCPDNKCIVGAIATYAEQAKCSSKLSQVAFAAKKKPHKPRPASSDDEQDNTPASSSDNVQLDALRFLIHFFGDITQPLHNEDRARGGNQLIVDFNGKSVNLHAVWDTQLVQTRVEEHSNQEKYVNYLISQIDKGKYSTKAKSWISTHDVFAKSKLGNSVVALEYSSDSDKIGCDGDVWSGYDKDPNQDFSQTYATNAAPIVDEQLAKGGYRLAQFLNELYSSCGPAKRSTIRK